MKVLVLCKRYSTGRDSLGDRYGRLYNLPRELARLGWQVDVRSLSYRSRVAGEGWSSLAGFDWRDYAFSPVGLMAYRADVLDVIRRPDIVWSSSDALHCVIGDRVASRLGVPHVVDLYDDYESFGLTRFPFLRGEMRAAFDRAAALTVVSRSLMEIVKERQRQGIRLIHVPNGVDEAPTIFGRDELLRRLGLASGVRLVGAVGALDPTRGIGDLFEAFFRLCDSYSDLHLVLAGRESGATRRVRHPRIHRLGQVPHQEARSVLAALDVSVVCNRDSRFARACHPMKLVESISAGVPVVAAEVGEVARVLRAWPECLYPSGDVPALVHRIAGQLGSPRRIDPTVVQSWAEVAVSLAAALQGAVGRQQSTLSGLIRT
ncbi:glycosyltransferase family 4 protein [Arenimonas sp. SCN 70-307]|uniref:glycosyltransferase family 4 protein n=1 Tax=Arenimonas sp. SCN 70-307 TaxID=1660089 RepID=UPI0025B7C8E3|nr:glycosyltransferase family 4 protein [Arenimonas sp. SCN 70-307]